MKTRRALIVAALAGIFVFASAERAKAQDLLSSLLYGLVLGTPYSGGLYGGAPYDPYGGAPYGGLYGGSAPYDPYGGTPYGGPYGNPPSYDPYGLSRGGYYEPSRGSYGPYPYEYDRGRDSRYRYQDRRGNLDAKYDKAMRRLDRQESEARAKAYRKSKGNPYRYREQMAKVDRKYDHKRYKVERNTAKDYRKLSDRYGRW